MLAVTRGGVALADRLADGGDVRLLPAAIPHDLHAITREVVPELQRRGLFRRAYEAGSLRERWGLERPPSRYAA